MCNAIVIVVVVVVVERVSKIDRRNGDLKTTTKINEVDYDEVNRKIK